jgi:hypothetical protein
MSPTTRGARRTAPLPRPKIEPRIGRLKIADRCDACGARAYVAAEIVGVDLLFCAHHFQRWEAAIREVAAELLDERWQLEQEERLRKEFYVG